MTTQHTVSYNSKGVLRNVDNDVYIGGVNNGVPHGIGCLSKANGDVYDGEWKNGYIHGKSKMICTNGLSYCGEWKNDLYDGKGTLITENGNATYTGDFVNGKFHGYGSINHNDGTKYVGQWEDSKFHGNGIFEQSNGTTYSGNWKCGMPEGTLYVVRPDNTSYTGVFEAYSNPDNTLSLRRLNGYGEEVYSNNIVYRGNFIDAKKYGYGTLIIENTCQLMYCNNDAILDSVEIPIDYQNITQKDFNNIKIVNIEELTTDEKDEIACPISIYRFSPIKTSCGHKFCKIEFDKYSAMEQKLECPVCRKKMDYYTVDRTAMEIIKRCVFDVNGKQMNYNTFIICYSFYNKFRNETLTFTRQQSEEEIAKPSN
jgi:hypothetical protein